MAIDEIERTEMVQKLIDTLGEKPAATLMKCVYPDGVDVFATRTTSPPSKGECAAMLTTPSAPHSLARRGCSWSPWPASC